MDLVDYNGLMYQCMWAVPADVDKKIGYHFLAYMVLLGFLLPLGLTFYAYLRILVIFYHSPVVFEALGIFRARYLIFAFIVNPLMQVPFYVLNFVPQDAILWPAISYPVCAFLAYTM